MTATPRGAELDRELLLVCDECGVVLRTSGTTVGDFAVIWNAARDVGWDGRKRLVGPHYCPRCCGALQ